MGGRRKTSRLTLAVAGLFFFVMSLMRDYDLFLKLGLPSLKITRVPFRTSISWVPFSVVVLLVVLLGLCLKKEMTEEREDKTKVEKGGEKILLYIFIGVIILMFVAIGFALLAP